MNRRAHRLAARSACSRTVQWLSTNGTSLQKLGEDVKESNFSPVRDLIIAMIHIGLNTVLGSLPGELTFIDC
jgi:hypothetical protein